MTNRREFLQTTATLTAAASFSPRASFATNASLALMAAIVDTRFAATAGFSAATSAQGVPTHEIGGDITAVWLNHLRERWAQQPAALAGLTARPALFCLEQLARDQGLRVVYHAEHKQLASGDMQHTVLTPLAGIDAALLTATGDHWPHFIAEQLNKIKQVPLTAGPSQACMPAFHNDDEITLHSWVLAPLV